MTNAKLLDQFYTNPVVAKLFTKKFVNFIKENELVSSECVFLEPSAGDGAFVDALALMSLPVIAADLDPKRDSIVQRNFLLDDLTSILPNKEVVIIGNPPFGKKSITAVDFIEKSFDYGETVGMILPVQFKKYMTQKKLRSNAFLVFEEDCPSDSFLFNGKPYDVRSVFQIWTTKETSLKDLRTRVRGATSHPDFQSWTYNATTAAEKVFSEDWTIAVRRQGWGSFEAILREDLKEPLSKKVQWILLKPASERVKQNLLNIDYEKLAESNTSVKGFGKTELVAKYNSLYGLNRTS